MKIVFTGAHGTGKSTLFNRLMTDVLPTDIKVSFQGVFDSYGRKLNTPLYTKEAQRQFNYWYVYNHYFTYSFISARSIYDTWVYSRSTAGFWYHNYLFNWAVKHINYDYVFYLPVEFPLVKDGIRPEDENYQLAFDKDLKLLLDFFHIPYITLSGSIEDRLNKIKLVINI